MNETQRAEYAELTARLGALLAAAYGDEAVSQDRLDIVRDDLAVAANDCLEESQF